MMHLRRITATVLACLLAFAAHAQTFPTSTPTYIPTAILSPVTKSAPFENIFVTGGTGTVTVRVSGTCTSLAAAPQLSNDQGAHWTTVPIFPVAGGASITSITATGFWKMPVAGSDSVRIHVTALTAACTFAMAGSPGSSPTPGSTGGFPSTSLVDSTGANTAGVKAASTAAVTTDPALVVAQSPNGDPCQIPSVPKLSAVINIGAATTTKVVDTSASTVIYVCSYTGSLAGTTPSIIFKTGTHVTNDCDTGAASLSGTILPTTGTMVSHTGGSGTIMQSSAGGQICVTTAGTGSSYQGIMTYVQR